MNEQRIKALERVVFGNGQPGIAEKVILHGEKIEKMEGHLEGLAKSFASLAKSQIEFDVTEKMKVKSKDNKYKMIAVATSVATICITVIIFILTH